jgi:CheY-like chemotaxis protein
MIVLFVSLKRCQGRSVLQATRSYANHDVVKSIEAGRLGKKPSQSVGRRHLVYFCEYPNAMACSRAGRVLQVGSRSASRNVRSGPNASSQAVYSIDKPERDYEVKNRKSSLVSIIDDDHWSREGVNCFLESCGYSCATFCTAEEYLSADAVRETACLIVDVQLPGMKGPELQDRLMAEGYRIPIIFVTGYCDDRIRDQVLRAGAIAYLTKPWCERALSGCLERAFGVGAR